MLCSGDAGVCTRVISAGKHCLIQSENKRNKEKKENKLSVPTSCLINFSHAQTENESSFSGGISHAQRAKQFSIASPVFLLGCIAVEVILKESLNLEGIWGKMQALKKKMQSFYCCGLGYLFQSLKRLVTRTEYDHLTEAQITGKSQAVHVFLKPQNQSMAKMPVDEGLH